MLFSLRNGISADKTVLHISFTAVVNIEFAVIIAEHFTIRFSEVSHDIARGIVVVWAIFLQY